jgi:hypothetical protein
MKLCFYVINIFALCALVSFLTSLISQPVLYIGAGSLDQHYHACASVGVSASDFGSVMSSAQHSAVRAIEQHTAELMMRDFQVAVASLITAHALALIGIFGIGIPQIAAASNSPHVNPPGSCAKRASTLIILAGTYGAYMYIFFMVVAQARKLSGEDGGEWTKNPDFGLHDGATCWGSNPWFTEFEETLRNNGMTIMLVLVGVNSLLIIISAVAYRPTTFVPETEPTNKDPTNKV